MNIQLASREAKVQTGCLIRIPKSNANALVPLMETV